MSTVPTQLMINNGTVTTHHIKSIQYNATAEPILTQLTKFHHWTDTISLLLNWRVFKYLNIKHQCATHAKHVHQCLSIQKTLHQRSFVSTPICCRCRLEDESDDHAILCPSSHKWRSELIEAYSTLGRKHQIDPQLVAMINQCLKLHAEGAIPHPDNFNNAFRQAITDQNGLGWINWYRGLISDSLVLLFPKATARNVGALEIFLNYTI